MKNLNASRPSEHPPVRGKNVKTFSRWDHRLQIQKTLFIAFANSVLVYLLKNNGGFLSDIILFTILC